MKHLQSALEVITRDSHPRRWALIHFNLGKLHWTRSTRGEDEASVQAEAHFRLALEARAIDVVPSEHREVQTWLARIFGQREDWERDHNALTEAIRAGRLEFAAAYTEPGRQAEIAETSGLFAEDTYALIRLDRPAEALLRLEDGKTQLLAQSLAIKNVDLSQLGEAERTELLALRGSVYELEASMRSTDLLSTRSKV